MDAIKGKKTLHFLKKFMTKKVIGVLVIVCIVLVVALGVGSQFMKSNQTTKLGFQDIGELATQCVYATEIGAEEKSATFFKVKIPFIQSKYIYTMDFEIKAGFDFEDIKWKVKGDDKIVVNMPKVKVLSNETRTDSFKVYHEEKSIFEQFSLDEVLLSVDDMKKSAEKTAIKNGLFDNAKTNAETIIKSFLMQEFDMKQYTVEFKYAK